MVAPQVETEKEYVMINFRSITHFAGFYIFYGLSWPLLRLPLNILYLLSDLFFILSFYFPGYRKKVVFNNLHNSFPEKTDKEIRKIARAFYQHMCDSLIESFAAVNMSKEQISRRCVWKNPEILENYFLKGRSVISVFGHYGNWEWFSGLPLYTNYTVLALYRPLRNSHFDRFMKSLRQKYGLKAIPVRRGYQVIREYQRKRVPTVTYFLSDQRPARDKIGYWTRFLNQDTPVMLGAERIARRLNQVVVFFSVNKLKRGYYEVEIIPVTEQPQSTADYEITGMHLRLLEEQITRNPEYWLWSHKRWKHKKPKVKQ